MRLYQLFYVTALIAASVNLFGLIGLAVGCAIVGAWYYVYSGEGHKRRSNALEVIVVTSILYFLACCLYPAVSTPRHISRRAQCNYCVKNLALALHNYESTWKQLPPAITYDANGRPMHSWRVLILPYIEEVSLYEKYSFDEPWDGPNNSKLMSQIPHTFRCPFLCDQPGKEFTTGYRVLIGERTCFPPNGTRRFDEIRDGLNNTLLVVESNQPVPWMAPIEPTVSEFLAEMKTWSRTSTPHYYSTLLTHCEYGALFSMVSADTLYCEAIMDERIFDKLAYIDNGAITESERDALRHFATLHVRWEGYVAILVFFSIAMLPAFWLVPSKKQTATRDVI